MMGWCVDGHHKECRVKYRRFYVGPIGRGRKKHDGIIWLDDERVCDCYCHDPNKKKPRKRTVSKRVKKKTNA